MRFSRPETKRTNIALPQRIPGAPPSLSPPPYVVYSIFGVFSCCISAPFPFGNFNHLSDWHEMFCFVFLRSKMPGQAASPKQNEPNKKKKKRHLPEYFRWKLRCWKAHDEHFVIFILTANSQTFDTSRCCCCFFCANKNRRRKMSSVQFEWKTFTAANANCVPCRGRRQSRYVHSKRKWWASRSQQRNRTIKTKTNEVKKQQQHCGHCHCTTATKSCVNFYRTFAHEKANKYLPISIVVSRCRVLALGESWNNIAPLEQHFKRRNKQSECQTRTLMQRAQQQKMGQRQ